MIFTDDGEITFPSMWADFEVWQTGLWRRFKICRQMKGFLIREFILQSPGGAQRRHAWADRIDDQYTQQEEIIMLYSAIKRIASEMMIRAMREWVRTGAVSSELLRLYWDLKYLAKFGIPEIPALPSTPLEDPTPTPMITWLEDLTPTLIVSRLRLYEDILAELVDIVAGDPSPQPSFPTVLYDRKIRLVAAKGLAQRLRAALDQLDTEIAWLEQKA